MMFKKIRLKFSFKGFITSHGWYLLIILSEPKGAFLGQRSDHSMPRIAYL